MLVCVEPQIAPVVSVAVGAKPPWNQP